MNFYEGQTEGEDIILIGDTPESMQGTIDYAESLNTMGAQYCTMTPYPGTALYERLEDDLLTQDFTQFTEYQPVADIKTSTPEEVTGAATRAYRYHLRWDWLRCYGLRVASHLLQNRLGHMLGLGKTG